MPAVRNIARERLERGELSLGVGVRIVRTVEIAKAMMSAGFDWLFIDLEHGASIDRNRIADCRRRARRRHRADRTDPERRVFDRDSSARQRRAWDRGAACRNRRRSALGRREAPLSAARPTARYSAVFRNSTSSRMTPADMTALERRQPDHCHAGIADSDRECVGDRGRPRHRRAADRHQRSLRRDGHSWRARPRRE